MRPSCFAFLLLTLLVHDPGRADDWPQYQGPGRDGVWPRPVFAGGSPAGWTLEERWRLPIGSGYSGVVIAGSRLFTMTSDGTDDLAVALDPASGAELWRTPLDATFPGDSGARPGPRSTPAVAYGTVFTVTPRGHLVALSATDGKLRWRHDLAAELGAVLPEYGIATSPLVDGRRLLVMAGGEDAYLAAFDVGTGELLWSESHGSGPSYASPKKATLAGVEQILVPSGEALYAVAPNDGSLLWSYPLAGLGVVDRMPLVVPGDRLFVPLFSSGGLMLNLRRANDAEVAGDGSPDRLQVEKLWDTPRLGNNTHGPPIYHDGHVYGMNGSLLVCISADDGTVRWRSRIYDGTLTLVDQKLVVMSAGSGKLHLVEASPEAFEEVLAMPLFEVGHHTVTPPSYADRTIYVRNVRELVALDLGKPGGAAAAPQIATRPPAAGKGLREIWRRPLATGLESAGEAGIRVDDGRVFTLAADAATEHALAVDAESGAELWRTPLDPRLADVANAPASTPAVADGRLFILSSACRLRALATRTGEVRWQRDLRGDFGTIPLGRGCQSSPQAVDELLVVQTGSEEGNRVVALRQADGALVWASDGLARTTYTSPVSAVLGGVPQVLVHGQIAHQGSPRSLLYSVRLADGKPLWSFQAEQFFSWLSPVVIEQEVLLATWRQSYLVTLPADPGTASEVPRATARWRQETLDSAVYVEGHVYAYVADEMVAIDAANGEVRWRQDNFFGSISVAGDRLAVLSFKTGRLRLVDASPEAYRERAHLDVHNAGAVNYVWPVFADGTIFVRNQEEMVAVAVGDGPCD